MMESSNKSIECVMVGRALQLYFTHDDAYYYSYTMTTSTADENMPINFDKNSSYLSLVSDFKTQDRQRARPQSHG